MAANRRPERAGFGRTTLACLLIAALSACGGGGDGDNAVSNSPDRAASAGGGAGINDANAVAQAQQRMDMASLFPQVKQHANQCAPDNPLAFDANGNSLAPAGLTYQKGTRAQEQQFIQTYMNQVYYWYKQMPSVDAAAPAYRTAPYGQGMEAYFAALKNPEKLASGRERDRHSVVVRLDLYSQLMQAEQAPPAIGADWARSLPASNGTAGASVHVVHVDQGSPAARAGLLRGDELLIARIATATGAQDVAVASISSQAELDELVNYLNSPLQEGTPVLLRVRSRGGQTRNVSLQAASYAKQLVPVVRTLRGADGASVGYLMVKAFQAPLEGQLKAAMERLKAEGVQDLVVDLRYNGGGQIYQSAQMAYMTVDPARSQGKMFARFALNDKMGSLESQPNFRQGFSDKTTGMPGTGTTAGQALPNLGLRRVYVLTTQTSCSASEEYINGLRGIDAEVVVIGDTTCGKPFVQIPQHNCGLAYLPILGRGLNAKGQGDYDEGIAPTCRVADDLSRAPGDANDPLMVAALHHRQHGACPAGTDPASAATKSLDTGAPAMRVLRSPLMEAGIVLPADFR